jgi:hypothetical protein
MIISHSRHFIFFHVPKSGGTTLTKLLDVGLSWNDIIVGGTKTGEVFNGEWAQRFRLFKHTTPSALRKVIGEDLFSRFHKFLFVRDPIQRFSSATQFLHQVVTEEREWVLRAYPEDHLNEILDLRSVQDAVCSNFFKSICDKDPGSCNEPELWFKPQSLYYSYLHHNYLGSSSFYKLENLESSIRLLCEMAIVTDSEIDLSQVLNVRSNESKKLLSSELDESIVLKLKEIYSEDYSLFGYN